MAGIMLTWLKIDAVMTPIVSGLILFLAFLIAKKFGGLYRKFFIIFGIGWIFQTLHRIDESILLVMMPKMAPEGRLNMSFPAIIEKMGIPPSPILKVFGLNVPWLTFKFLVLAIGAGLIACALFIHYKITSTEDIT